MAVMAVMEEYFRFCFDLIGMSGAKNSVFMAEKTVAISTAEAEFNSVVETNKELLCTYREF